jgi:hypothetical protein
MADRRLVVELHGEPIGVLVGTGDSFDFEADDAAIRQYGLVSTAMSLAAPGVGVGESASGGWIAAGRPVGTRPPGA